MRTLKMTIGVAVAACAFAVLAAPSFAVKPKMVFGEFEAHIEGQEISPSKPASLRLSREGSISIHKLSLGNYTFGPIARENVEQGGKVIWHAGEQEVTNPCKSIKVKPGSVTWEKSSQLTVVLKFSKCVAVAENGTVEEEVPTSFTMALSFHSNFSAEVGKSENTVTIEEIPVLFKGALKKCPVTVPRQTIPFRESPEKVYEEIVEYENESEEPEGWEHSKKLKELYPSGEKEFLNIFFEEEKFHHIHSYVSQAGPCTNTKGTENGKIVPKGEPHEGELEFTNGSLEGSIELLEIKFGDLKFKEAE